MLRNESGAAVVPGSNWVAVAQHSPESFMHQLQSPIEGNGLQRQMSTLFSGKPGIHPRLCRLLLGMYCCGEDLQSKVANGAVPQKRLQ